MATYNETPLEVLSGPVTLYRAVVGTSFPVVDAAPSGSWTLVGTNGALNYEPGSGVSVKRMRSTKEWRGLGAGAPTKVFGGEEGLEIKLTLMDLTLAQLSVALNANTVTTVAASAGVAGYKSIPMESGLLVPKYALLIRGASAEYDGVGQFEVPIAYQSGEPEIVYKQDEPAGLALVFRALRHSSLGLGLLKMQTAAAS